MEETIVIQEGKRTDCPTVRKLIQELADFDDMSDGPKISEKALERDAFDANPPLFKFYVATLEDKVIGYALFHFSYCSWSGKSLSLEDIYVIKEYRKKNIGSMLFNKVVQFAVDNKCCHLNFIVLNVNPVQDFYKKRGAVDITLKNRQHLFQIGERELKKLCGSTK